MTHAPQGVVLVCSISIEHKADVACTNPAISEKIEEPITLH